MWVLKYLSGYILVETSLFKKKVQSMYALGF